MNILQTDFHLTWSGQTARILDLSRELVRRGHGVTIAAPPGSALVRRAREAGLKVFDQVAFRKPHEIFHLFRDMRALHRLIRREDFDIVHVHGSEDSWTLALTVNAFGLKQPIVMTRHNIKPVGFHAANRWLYGSAIRRLVAVSSATLQNYQRFFDAGVLRRDEVSVIDSCIDVDRFSGLLFPNRVRAELGAAPGAPVIGVIARINRDKGHMVLLDAAPEILSVFPRAIFVFAGKGGLNESVVREAIAARGLERSVRMLGFREDIPDITAALDVSVLPTLGTDASPAVIKEALFLGTPVVASRVGGIPEMVTKSAGLLVPPGDAASLAAAIISILKHRPAGCVRSRFPECFTPEHHCAAYLRVYFGMLEAVKAVRSIARPLSTQ
jgi:glycosyltransferase involved in cell wall biosynthesis